MLLTEYSQEQVDSAIAKSIDYFSKIESIDMDRMQRQIEISVEIINVYRSGVPNVIMEAPTGFGKSILGFFLTKVLDYLEPSDNNAYMLTSNKFLQDQYNRDIQEFGITQKYAVLKGQSNYMCTVNRQPFTQRACADVSIGKLKDDSDWSVCAATCPYVIARDHAMTAATTVFNYSYWLTSMNLVFPKLGDRSPFKPRALTIFDEAHMLGDIIQNMFSVDSNIDYQSKLAASYYKMQSRLYSDLPQSVDSDIAALYDIVKRLDEHQNSVAYTTQYELIVEYGKVVAVLLDKFSTVATRLMKVKQPGERVDLTEDQKRFCAFSDSLQSLYDGIHTLSKIYDDCGHDSIVLTVEQRQNQRNQNWDTFVKLQCTDEAVLVQNHVLRYGMNNLFMSATIGDVDKFAKQHGITDYHKLLVESDFEFNNSPIYKVTPSLKMSYKYKRENLPKLLEYVKKILAYHPDERGIIHTGNYEFMNALKQIQDPRLLFYENAGQKPEVMRKLAVSKNSVICGPSILEGVDLKDDLARFMIFMKVPYKAIGDKLTKRKMEKYEDWYGWITSVHVQQGMGRPIRHKHDWAATYLLDGGFDWFFMKNTPVSYIKKRITATNINSLGSSLDNDFDKAMEDLF